MRPRTRSDPGFGFGPPKYPGSFMLAFREALASQGWQARRWLGHAVDCVDAEGSSRIVGLENLYRRLRSSDRAEWLNLITAFLQTALGPEGEGPPPLAEAASQLLVRLGPPLRGEPDEPRAWAHPLNDTGLVLNLVIDYPDRMIYATDPMIEASGKSGAEWLKLALDNLRSRSDPSGFEVIHDDSGLLICNVADAYDSSRALLLDALLPVSLADGYFVAVPCRDQLLVLPVTSTALGFIHLLKMECERAFRSEPYPISAEVFWVRGDRWHPFRVAVEGERVLLGPPQEFAEVLERLEVESQDADEDERPPDSSSDEPQVEGN